MAVFLGGCCGGLGRYAVTEAWPVRADGFPWATFVVNTAGAAALSLLLVLLVEARPRDRYLRLTLGTGFLGAWTTFSAVTTQTAELLAHRQFGTATAYLVATVVVGLGAAWLGFRAGRLLTWHRPAGSR
ncbi:MAG TPA: CrcB family protein [Mycobacteriales bacterium]|nr:CrcB family protein [Mycobacteriales bacterium]